MNCTELKGAINTLLVLVCTHTHNACRRSTFQSSYSYASVIDFTHALFTLFHTFLLHPLPSAGEDYLLPSTLLQFRGETSLPLSISTVNDNMPEPTEEFQAGLSVYSSDMGLNVTADGSFVPFTIIHDDG